MQNVTNLISLKEVKRREKGERVFLQFLLDKPQRSQKKGKGRESLPALLLLLLLYTSSSLFTLENLSTFAR